MADTVQSQNPSVRKPLTHERLLELLDYNPETGVFTWKMTPPKGKGRTRHRPGSVAGSTDVKGYIKIGIDGKSHYAHRLAWFYVYGVWPSDEIDHISRKKNDNRIAFLREATKRQQGFNSDAHSNSKSGIKGVHWNVKNQHWQACIRTADGRNHLGTFLTKEEAAQAYEAAAIRLHGEFANPTKCASAPSNAS